MSGMGIASQPRRSKAYEVFKVLFSGASQERFLSGKTEVAV
jgi:hypothetical protein